MPSADVDDPTDEDDGALTRTRFSRHNLASFRPLIVFDLGSHQRRRASSLLVAASLCVVAIAIALAFTLVLCSSALSQPTLETLRLSKTATHHCGRESDSDAGRCGAGPCKERVRASEQPAGMRAVSAPTLAAVAALALCTRGTIDVSARNHSRGCTGARTTAVVARAAAAASLRAPLSVAAALARTLPVGTGPCVPPWRALTLALGTLRLVCDSRPRMRSSVTAGDHHVDFLAA